jgi:mevalonate kinase
MIEVSIYGKVMLSGEYSVLGEGMAAMAPVPRSLVVREANVPTQVHERPTVREALQASIPHVASYEETHGLPNIDLDDRSFFVIQNGVRQKLGIGLSAAETVGVIALRIQRAGIDWTTLRRRAIEIAIGAHSRAQGAIGSGADVAVCATGSPILFKNSSTGPVIHPIDTTKSNGVRIRLVFSGRSFDTRPAVKLYQDWLDRVGESLMVRRWRDRGEHLARMWFTADWPSLRDALDQYMQTHAEVMKQAGIEWWLPVHTEWALKCRDVGARSKPVGAGGGDVVLLVGERLPEPEGTYIDIV